MPVRVKVCCIADLDEAKLAVRLGASALGLVSHMPSGPGVIAETRIREIAAATPPAIGTFLLTSLQDVPSIVVQQRRCCVNTLQLCDRLVHGTYEELRVALPGISLVQVIHVTGAEAINEAVHVAPYVDALLLDSGDRRLSVKLLGGTGRTHDWSVSRRIREAVRVPVFLAGGLNVDNVSHAIAEVQPFGVDLCTGVRREGRLVESRLADFFRAVLDAS